MVKLLALLDGDLAVCKKAANGRESEKARKRERAKGRGETEVSTQRTANTIETHRELGRKEAEIGRCAGARRTERD